VARDYVSTRARRGPVVTRSENIGKRYATREDLWLRTPGSGPPARPKSEIQLRLADRRRDKMRVVEGEACESAGILELPL
jgi:hypothetical protein